MSFLGDPPSSVPEFLGIGSSFLLPPIIVLFFNVVYPLKNFYLLVLFPLKVVFFYFGLNAASSTISLNLTEGTVISIRFVVCIVPVYSAL